MASLTPNAATETWETRLADAARRYVDRLFETRTQDRDPGHELRATLLRLGFAPSDVEAAVRRDTALAPSLLAAMRTALKRELDALSRRARAGRADYDLNRHIAVFRADRALGARDAPQAPPGAPASRPSRAARSSATAAPVRAIMRR